MNKKKKIIISASLIITSVSILGLAVIAGAFGPAHSFHTRGIPPFMQKEIGEFILWKLDKSTRGLNFNSDQQNKYNTFRASLEKTITTCLDTKLEVKQHVIAEFDKEAPDLSSITTELQSHIEQMSSRFTENLAQFNTFFNILTDNQKKQITDHIKERHQACRNAYLSNG